MSVPTLDPKIPVEVIGQVIRNLRIRDSHTLSPWDGSAACVEISAVVREASDHIRTLCCLCRVSSVIAVLAYRELYRSIAVDEPYRGCLSAARWLQLPDYLGYSMAVRHVDPAHKGIASVMPLIERLYLSDFINGGFRGCRNLRHLTFKLGSSESLRVVQHRATLLGQEMDGLNVLTSLNFDIDGAVDVCVYAAVKRCVFKRPSITRLGFRGEAKLSDAPGDPNLHLETYRNDVRKDKVHNISIVHLSLYDVQSDRLLDAITRALDPYRLCGLDLYTVGAARDLRWIVKAGWPALESLKLQTYGMGSTAAELDEESMAILNGYSKLRKLCCRLSDISILRYLPSTVTWLLLGQKPGDAESNLLWLIDEFKTTQDWYAALIQLEISDVGAPQASRHFSAAAEAAAVHGINIVWHENDNSVYDRVQ